MSDVPQEAWFYTREGERIGPVTFAELRVTVLEGELNPRLDMVWTQTMAEWKPAGQIEGLFEKRSVAHPPASPASAADPYTPPTEEPLPVGEWPGARRRGFLVATFIFPLVWMAAFDFGAKLLVQQFGEGIMGYIGIGVACVPLLVGIIYGLKRLRNLGMSRWWYLANFVPLLHLWVGYRCFACPAGYAYHKKLDGAGVALAILYWLVMLICLLAIVALLAVLLGAIDNPEIREQLNELVRAAREQAIKP